MPKQDTRKLRKEGHAEAPEAAARALAEATARRDAAARTGAPAEIGGRGGLEPVRYGDWEVNGRASDF